MTADLDRALFAMRESGGAEPFMRHAAACVRRMAYVRNAIDEGADAFAAGGGGTHGGIGDPTASRALFELTVAGDILDALRRELSELELAVGHALVLIDSVREDMGDGIADAVERHYIDGESWQEVADGSGVSRRMAIYRAESAFAYLDSLASCGD